MHASVTPEPIDLDLLMLAYRSGIFPMSDGREDPEIFWVEPRMRAILPLEGFRLSRSLRRTLRRERFRVTCNEAFGAVIAACAETPRGGDEASTGSWISRRIEAAYTELHDKGMAHSIECWSGASLVGGLYGVGFDGVFCGESMFSRQTDASKVALAWLVAAMRHGRFTLLDCQFVTDHLASLGAKELRQEDYVEALRAAQRHSSASAASSPSLPASFSSLSGAAEAAGDSPGNFIAQCLTQTS